jgi:hypothetical protein
VAYEAGLFKKYGLNASLQLLTPQVSAQAVISEEADFYTDGPDLINARLRGGQVKYFGGTMQQLVFQMWGAKEIIALDDLEGKTVAASTPRAALDTATREALKKNGLVPDKDVQILYVQTVPAILSSILGGKTAAGALSAPNTIKAKESGLNLLVDIGKLNIRRSRWCTVPRRNISKIIPTRFWLFSRPWPRELRCRAKTPPSPRSPSPNTPRSKMRRRWMEPMRPLRLTGR